MWFFLLFSNSVRGFPHQNLYKYVEMVVKWLGSALYYFDIYFYIYFWLWRHLHCGASYQVPNLTIDVSSCTCWIRIDFMYFLRLVCHFRARPFHKRDSMDVNKTFSKMINFSRASLAIYSALFFACFLLSFAHRSILLQNKPHAFFLFRIHPKPLLSSRFYFKPNFYLVSIICTDG